ncbi:MAG: NUDIX hydrolase [Candidatus Peribacteraceae bacterium]|nr:NUDIX hydrolase [Candidatus Peribacteraceae bacterium]|tara:strand:- start:207 stop:665 length:459 start_codon:yes stop_codon:yes gene_type:complete
MTEEIYRSCASIAVFRPAGSAYEMLFVHKPRKKDAWQLPQGGVEEGETSAQAAIREVEEEAGITTEVIGSSDEVYQYDFPASYRRFRPDNVKGQRIEYVFARVDADTKVQVDDDEIDQFVWVVPSQFAEYIKRTEYLELITKLYNDGTALLS